MVEPTGPARVLSGPGTRLGYNASVIVSARVSSVAARPLRTIDAPCPLCGGRDATPLLRSRDRAFGIPGSFTVARCRGCRLLYQRPRVSDEDLAACYPEGYPRHVEPSPRMPFTGSVARVRAVRWVLADRLGYVGLSSGRASLATRIHGSFLLRRVQWSCPPWRGTGRYLDVGCGSGSTLGVARALGWTVAGIELDAAAADKARRYAGEVHGGDVLSAPFGPGQFDVVSAFHVLEHVPEPVAVMRRMLEWLAPGGLAIVEVPNAGGLGAALFGDAWAGLELPRHLWHFTPTTLRALIDRAGGRIVWTWHQAKPRYYLWSLRHLLRDRGWRQLARATEGRAVYDALKAVLELTLPLAAAARRGEVMRVGVVPATAARP